VFHLKAHYVSAVEPSAEEVVVEIDRLKSRTLRWGFSAGRCRKVHQMKGGAQLARPASAPSVDGTALSALPGALPTLWIRVEAVPWTQLWARLTTTLARAVAEPGI